MDAPVMPQDLRTLVPGQYVACVRYLAGNGYKELRRMQALTVQQIGMAYAQRNDQALANLQIRERMITQAILIATE